MPWPNRIERWRQFVTWECKDVSPELVLAIIQKESNGVAGKIANSTCKPWPIPTIDGKNIIYDRALGLMQIVPRTIDGYNQDNPSNVVYYEEMKGTDERSARLQIRVGCYTYAKSVNRLHLFFPDVFLSATPKNATPEQLKLAIAGYRMGNPALKIKLDKLLEEGRPLTYEELQNRFPNWGGDTNRVYHYTSKVWANALNNGMMPGQPPDWQPGPEIPGPPESQLAGAKGVPWLFVIGLGLWAYKKYREIKSDE